MYSTVENVNRQVRYIQSASTITSADKAGFIAEAETIVNAKLSNLYVVPFSSTPPIVETITTKIAALSVLRSIGIKDADDKENLMKHFKEFGVGLLCKLAEGEMTLVDSAGTVVTQNTTDISVDSTTENYKPIFDMRDIIYQGVDPDLIDDENAASI